MPKVGAGEVGIGPPAGSDAAGMLLYPSPEQLPAAHRSNGYRSR